METHTVSQIAYTAKHVDHDAAMSNAAVNARSKLVDHVTLQAGDLPIDYRSVSQHDFVEHELEPAGRPTAAAAASRRGDESAGQTREGSSHRRRRRYSRRLWALG